MLLRAPIRFIAIASDSCASLLIEPYDIAPVLNRLTIDSTGSTSAIGIGSRLDLSRIKLRNVQSFPVSSSISRLYSLKSS